MSSRARGARFELFFVLEGRNVVPATREGQWREFFEQTERRVVARMPLGEVAGVALEVSTVFMGVNVAGTDPPLVFETVVFGGGEGAEKVVRSATWEAAEQAHQRLVNAYREIAGRILKDPPSR
jgi:hypothetical protein